MNLNLDGNRLGSAGGVLQIPNCVRRLSRIEWSTLSNVELRSKRTRSVTCFWFMLRRIQLFTFRAQSECCDVYGKQTASWGKDMGIKITGNLMGSCFFNNFRGMLGYSEDDIILSLGWMIAGLKREK